MTEKRLADIYRGKNFSDFNERDEGMDTGEPYEPETGEDAEPAPVPQPAETLETPRERVVKARDTAMKKIKQILDGNNEDKDGTDEAHRIKMIRERMLKMDKQGMRSTQEST